MINRELKAATLITYDGVDEYGQMLTTPIAKDPIYISLNIFSHSQTDDIRYNQVSHTGLTKHAINDKQSILLNGKEYKVIFVSPHKVWNEVFLCQK